jgi:fluoride ion exporter CrcB/FEX
MKTFRLTRFFNVLGAFALAFILTIAFEIWTFDSDIRLGVTTGFLGAFTTFSTLCKETVGLMQNGDIFPQFIYDCKYFAWLGAAYLESCCPRNRLEACEERAKTDNIIEMKAMWIS